MFVLVLYCWCFEGDTHFWQPAKFEFEKNSSRTRTQAEMEGDVCTIQMQDASIHRMTLHQWGGLKRRTANLALLMFIYKCVAFCWQALISCGSVEKIWRKNCIFVAVMPKTMFLLLKTWFTTFESQMLRKSQHTHFEDKIQDQVRLWGFPVTYAILPSMHQLIGYYFHKIGFWIPESRLWISQCCTFYYKQCIYKYPLTVHI